MESRQLKTTVDDSHEGEVVISEQAFHLVKSQIKATPVEEADNTHMRVGSIFENAHWVEEGNTRHFLI